MTIESEEQEGSPERESAQGTPKAAARSRRAPAEGAPAPATRRTAGRARGTRPRAAAEAPSEKRAKPAAEQRTLPRLLARYREEIRGQLMREFGYKSSMQAPRVSKVVLNIGLGEALTNSRALDVAPQHLGVISGQKPVFTKARRSVAGFKVREGQAIGVMVTLRGRRMYEFLDRMISFALPRIRDFRGLPRTSFDGKGDYSLGIREQIIFPEVDYDTVDKVRGLQVTIVTTADTDPEGFRLLELMGMPFTRQPQAV